MNPVISWKNYHWEYLVFGNGPEILFAFHGFDNDASDFRIFEKILGKKYRIVAINLFFHGTSRLDEAEDGNEFSPEDLKELFSRFLFEFQCSHFSLIGFSLGGRIALQLVQQFPERVNRVILLAPDGLKISRWYVFVTHHVLGKWIFSRVVRNPSRFLKIAWLFRSLHLVGSKQYIFAMANFDTPEKRQKVYNVWMIFRNILPDIHQLRSTIEKNQIRMHLFFGRYDTIIRPSFGINFLIGLDAPVKIDVLDMGHNLMKEKVNPELEKILAED